MKGYKFLVPIFLVVLYVASIYVLYTDRLKTQQEYDSYIQTARQYREDGIYTDALVHYQNALDVIATVELYVEIGELYIDMKQIRTAMDWGENIIDVYPKKAEGYEFMMSIYKENQDYTAMYDLYDTIVGMNIKSEYIEQEIDKIQYVFFINSNEYLEVTGFANSYCAVRRETKWGFATQKGGIAIGTSYISVGTYSGGLAPVVDKEGNAYYIDNAGNKKKVINSIEGIVELGRLENGIFSANNGKSWGLYKEDGTVIADGFVEISNISDGYAAVSNGDDWSVIDSTGKIISSDKYDEIIMDEKKIIIRNNRIFVVKGNSYYMLDEMCNKVNETAYQEADIFRGGSLAAVKIGGKWGFIDNTGTVVIEPQYEQARSFSNGYAAVKIDDKWGFINEKNEMVIDVQFLDAKDFTGQGTVFVKQSDMWQMLLLYKYNH